MNSLKNIKRNEISDKKFSGARSAGILEAPLGLRVNTAHGAAMDQYAASHAPTHSGFVLARNRLFLTHGGRRRLKFLTSWATVTMLWRRRAFTKSPPMTICTLHPVPFKRPNEGRWNRWGVPHAWDKLEMHITSWLENLKGRNLAVEVQVKLSLGLIKHHIMKMYGDMQPPLLNTFPWREATHSPPSRMVEQQPHHSWW
jgi:hypothetical protein